MNETFLDHPLIVDSYDKVLFCRKCGKKLLENSSYCCACGTAILYAS